MNHPSTAAAYDQLAGQWADGRFNRENGMAQHRRALAFLGAPSPGWALLAGCGCNTRFHALLRGHDLRLEGVDVSGTMIARARAADPDVVLHHADLCDWPVPRRYRFISGWDSLWHVPLERQRELMMKLLGALEPGGVFVFSAGGLDAPAEHVDATMGPEVYYSTLGIPGLLDAIRDAGCAVRHLEFDQHPENHLVVIAQRGAP